MGVTYVMYISKFCPICCQPHLLVLTSTNFLSKKMKNLLILLIASASLVSCGGNSENQTDANNQTPKSMVESETASSDPMDNKGIGPVTSVELGAVNDALVAEAAA